LGGIIVVRVFIYQQYLGRVDMGQIHIEFSFDDILTTDADIIVDTALMNYGDRKYNSDIIDKLTITEQETVSNSLQSLRRRYSTIEHGLDATLHTSISLQKIFYFVAFSYPLQRMSRGYFKNQSHERLREFYWKLIDWIKNQGNISSVAIPLVGAISPKPRERLDGSSVKYNGWNRDLPPLFYLTIDLIENYQRMYPNMKEITLTFYLMPEDQREFDDRTEVLNDLIAQYNTIHDDKYQNTEIDQVFKWMTRNQIKSGELARIAKVDLDNLNKRLKRGPKRPKMQRDLMIRLGLSLELQINELQAFLAYGGYSLDLYDPRDRIILEALDNYRFRMKEPVLAIDKLIRSEGLESLIPARKKIQHKY
jgi:hypothetical protein